MITRSLAVSAFILLLTPALAFAVGDTTGTSAGSSDQSSGLTSPTSAGPSDANVPPSENVQLINPLKGGGTLESFLVSILAFVVRIGAIAVILMLVFIGYKFVTARGEPGAITKAKEMLLWTVIGALILLGAQAIASAIQATVQALSVGQ